MHKQHECTQCTSRRLFERIWTLPAAIAKMLLIFTLPVVRCTITSYILQSQRSCALFPRGLNLRLLEDGSLWCGLHMVLHDDDGIVGAQNLDA